ncbi:MAG: DsbA family protein [Pseudomonadota bacterium]
MSQIEYFYSAHSAFAWLGHARLREIAAQTGRTIRHAPISLDPVLAAAGSVAFRERPAGHVRYYFGREIARWAEERGKTDWLRRMPTHHRRPYAFANQAIIAAQAEGMDADALSEAFLTAHWERDADLSDRDVLAALAEGAGLDAAALFAAADGEAAAAQHEANVAEAVERSVFGSPTYFVDGDMFYGQDRLEMVARACDRPYAA